MSTHGASGALPAAGMIHAESDVESAALNDTDRSRRAREASGGSTARAPGWYSRRGSYSRIPTTAITYATQTMNAITFRALSTGAPQGPSMQSYPRIRRRRVAGLTTHSPVQQQREPGLEYRLSSRWRMNSSRDMTAHPGWCDSMCATYRS